MQLIIIMEICKHPPYRNILTAQGMHTGKNSDNMLVTATTKKIFQKYTFTYFIVHTHMHTRGTHTRKQARVQHVCIDTGKSTGNVGEVRVCE